MQDGDMCKIGTDKKILKQLSPNQTVVFSIKLIKINRVEKRQERILVLTDKNLYNVVEEGFFPVLQRVRRRISFQNISALSVSRKSPEFVVHVDIGHDYRFWSINAKMRTVECLIDLYCKFHNQLMAVRFYEELSLKEFTTTITDIKKKRKKKHVIQPVKLSPNTLKTAIEAKSSSKLVFRNYTAGDEDNSLQEFEIVKVLGRGAYGKVMLCRNRNRDKYYAIKSMRKDKIIEAARFQEVKSERELLQKTNHPFLISLLYAFQTPEKVFLVMDFVRGGELYCHIRQEKRIPERQAQFYAAQVVLALSYMHSLGYIYRDLKPDNILIDCDGYIKISDYGTAKYLQEDEKTYSMIGTPLYVSPEVISRKGQTYCTDWWALGVLIYEMIYGFPPFYSSNYQKLLSQILVRQVTFKDKEVAISSQCRDIIRKLLNKDPNKRLGSKGPQQIQKHAWFGNINWQKMLKKQYTPEFIPNINSQDDVTNFDPNLTAERPIDSLIITDAELLEQYKTEFVDFNYQCDSKDKLVGKSQECNSNSLSQN